MRWFLLALALLATACVNNGDGDDDDDKGGGNTTGGSGGGNGTNGGGTGGSGTNGGGTGGSGTGGGGTSGSNGGGDCANIVGIWAIDGGCGADVCTISQNGCTTSLLCGSGSVSYTGSLSGDQVTYSGESGGGLESTCQGTVNGGTMTGTCTSSLGSCPFSAQRQ